MCGLYYTYPLACQGQGPDSQCVAKVLTFDPGQITSMYQCWLVYYAGGDDKICGISISVGLEICGQVYPSLARFTYRRATVFDYKP